MTCIVGLVHADGTLYMGGDSAGVEDSEICARSDRKVFHPNKDKSMLIGFAGSFRGRDLLEFVFTPPPIEPKMDEREYMVKRFIPKVRSVFKGGGHSTIEDNAETTETVFLVGFNKRIFTIDVDYQVGENHTLYSSVGSGSGTALGAMYVADMFGENMHPETRILHALEASEAFNTGVRSPHYCLSIGPRTRFRSTQ